MSRKTHEAFNKFLAEVVNFSGAEREQGSISHNYLRAQLTSYASSHANFPNLISGDFLSGSFGRRTAVKPLDDIDVFMIMDGVGLRAVRGGQYVSDVVEGTTSVARQINWDLYHGTDGNISSRKVLQEFRTALRETIYTNSEVGNAEQAVNVWLSSYGLGLDVVPAFHLVQLGSGHEYYFIPAGRGRDDWIETNPKLDAGRLAAVGGDDISKLRDVVRVVRYWNQECNEERLSGYHIEVMTLRILENYVIDQRRHTVGYVLNSLPSYIAASCPSQTGFGGNIDSELNSADRQASAYQAQIAGAALTKARFLEDAGDHEHAIHHWQVALGDEFPAP